MVGRAVWGIPHEQVSHWAAYGTPPKGPGLICGVPAADSVSGSAGQSPLAETGAAAAVPELDDLYALQAIERWPSPTPDSASRLGKGLQATTAQSVPGTASPSVSASRAAMESGRPAAIPCWWTGPAGRAGAAQLGLACARLVFGLGPLASGGTWSCPPHSAGDRRNQACCPMWNRQAEGCHSFLVYQSGVRLLCPGERGPLQVQHLAADRRGDQWLRAKAGLKHHQVRPAQDRCPARPRPLTGR